MTLRPTTTPLRCAECSAPLAADQRYCLRCGARHGTPRVDPLDALGFAADDLAAPAGASGLGVANAAGAEAPSSRRTPSRRLTVALAAVTLALGALLGAALGPGPAPSVAAAPQRLVALVIPSATPATSTTEEGDTADSTPPVDAGSATTPTTTAAASDGGSEPGTTTSTATTEDPAPTATDTTPTTTTPAAAGTAPAHVWIVSLAQLDAGAFSPTSPLGDLAARGTVLSGYVAGGPSAAANEVALLGGQVPEADCDADLAACVLPAGETSLPDQLTSIALTWRAYVEDAAQRCAAAPSARVGVSLFTTLTSRDDCATRVAGLDALDADLADAAKTPALSLLVPTTADLRDLVARITASKAYRSDGVLVVLSDAPGAAGALVLSPRATAGATVATATGPVALLRSLDDLFGLPPLSAAADAPAGALDGVLAPTTSTTPTTAAPPSTTSTTTRRSP